MAAAAGLGAAAALFFVALAGVACSSSTTTSKAATSTTTPTCLARHVALGRTSQSFVFMGQPRTYQLYVPTTYTGTHPVPVVFDFHGYGSNAVEQLDYSDFQPLADRDGFLIVAPNGQGNGDRHFNLTGEPGLQPDVPMVGALLDHIEATMCVDTRRVYSTGMSDGGAMTSTLACADANRFAAFAAVAVILYPPVCASQPVPIVAFSGTADPVVPFNGGMVHCCDHTTVAAAPTAVAAWAQHDGCAAAPSEDVIGTEVRRQTWPGCRPGSAVVFYVIEGGGHTWPGAIPIPSLGMTTNQVNATATIWAFFQAHSLP